MSRRPSRGINQRAIDREMLPAHLPANIRMVDYARRQFGRGIHLQKTIPVLGEGRGIPDWIVNSKPDKPAKEQIKIDPFHQLLFRSERVEHLQQQRAQTLLRRDRRPANGSVSVIKRLRHAGENIVRNPPDHPQRMRRRHTLLQIDIGKRLPSRAALPRILLSTS